MAGNTRKLRILCLHGYKQSAPYFQEKMHAFRKSLKRLVHLEFITAPHEVDDPITETENFEEAPLRQKGYSWWFCDESSIFNSLQPCISATGFEESVNAIIEAFQRLGPFDGILGFSQGAAMAALICALKEHNGFPHEFQFAVIISGFKSLAVEHQFFYTTPITTKSLHVIGENDLCIPEERSAELVQHFQFCEVAYHEGGHYVSCSHGVKIKYRSFFGELHRSINEV